MSISKVHELIQNKGCVWTVSILMILSMVIGSFYSCGRANELNGMMDAPTTVVGKVGTHDITERLVQSEIAKASQMYGGMELPPSFMIQMQAGALRSIVGSVLQLDIAKKYGIEASDADIEKLIVENINQEVASQKQNFIMQGKLKDTSTEAEFAALFKKEAGRDLAEVKEEALKQNLEALKRGPDIRIPLAAMTVGEPLMAAIKKEVKISDEDLKKSFDSFEFKRITLNKGNPDEKAKKIVQELKGGLSFEAAMDRYDESPPEANKKPSQKVEAPMRRSTLQGWDAYQPLENLKPGQVSEPITIGQTVNLFKLIKVKSELPKDFEKQKDTLRDTQLTTMAAQKLQKDLMAAQKTAKVEWSNPTYGLLYDFGRITAENLPSEQRAKEERRIMEESIKLANEGGAGESRIASGLAYVIFQNLTTKATTDAEKKALDADKVKVYEAFLRDNEDSVMRLELVEVFKAQKNSEKFYEQLVGAANGNMAAVDASGQNTYNKINKFVKEGQDAKLLTTEQVANIQDLQQQWKSNKTDQEKWDAEQKAADAKAAAEAKKAADAEKKKGIDNVKTREESEKEKAGGKK